MCFLVLNIRIMKKVLIVEDDPEIVNLLEIHLNDLSCEVLKAMDGKSGLEKALSIKPDLIILDISLPEMDGIEVCRQVRNQSNVPIIMLTAKSEEIDRVLGLEMGADDYITKPFDPIEVVARVRARLRSGPRAAQSGQANVAARFTGWQAHFDRFVLCDENGEDVPFSQAEGEVLRLFLENPKRLISRAQMQEHLGGAAGESFDRAMDVCISRLRTKLRDDQKNPKLIKTIYGAGYIFLDDVEW